MTGQQMIDTRIRVAVVDDQELFRRGVTMLLGVEEDIVVVGEAGDGGAVADLVAATDPHVVLLDIAMPVVDGLVACAELTERFPSVRVVMLTESDDQRDLAAALRNGALGYLLKDSTVEQMADAIREVRQGRAAISPAMTSGLVAGFKEAVDPDHVDPVRLLTRREREVLTLLARGLNNRDLAEALFISENTVKNHVRSILEKLGLRSRVQAAMYAVREGLADRR